MDVISDTQTITNPAIDERVDYTILGGTAPYTAFSGNPSLVQVRADGEVIGGRSTGTLTATVVGIPVEDTTVTITILDADEVTVDTYLTLDVP
ncbi:hypothetical protein M1N02_03145 [Thermodesulfovibrionales bacterium]|nr:hypothetical protein [Thermodesulfovibrionales bacterium]